jgi:rhodanese-related sulfurtransferase
LVCLAFAIATLVSTETRAIALDWGRGEYETEVTVVKIVREVAKGGYGTVSTDELKGWMDGRRDMLLVDTMPPGDYRGGHLPGAVSFELPCPEPYEMPVSQQQALDKLLGGKKDRLIVFSCEFTRCGRSHNGAFWARKLGYTNVFRHPGGLKSWRQADYPVQKGR